MENNKYYWFRIEGHGDWRIGHAFEENGIIQIYTIGHVKPLSENYEITDFYEAIPPKI